MKKTAFGMLFAMIFTVSAPAYADPIGVTYQFGDYSHGGFSGSWLHAATGCESEGAGGTLYMCGDKDKAYGSMSGMFDDASGILTITGGWLSVDGTDYKIDGGTLGGAGVMDWYITVSGLGTFFFEQFDMGDGMPNLFGIDELILWGQNKEAYCGAECENRWGIDLYAKAEPVPEPGTLLLLAVGLFGIALMQRRSNRTYASSI